MVGGHLYSLVSCLLMSLACMYVWGLIFSHQLMRTLYTKCISSLLHILQTHICVLTLIMECFSLSRNFLFLGHLPFFMVPTFSSKH